MPESLTSRRLRLRYVTSREVPLLDAHYADAAGGFNDFGPGPLKLADDAWTGDQLRNERRGMLFVERKDDDAILGTISYHRVSYGPNDESDQWMIGIELGAEARGQGYGTEAQRLLADWLFATTGVNRVEAATDVENIAEARSLEKAGFIREGVIRGAQFRAGAYHDLVLFSRLRPDP